MAGVLDSVNQRTQMVGQNRLELLLFRLDGKQVYGINVFKVKEVLQCPPLTEIPQRSSVVRGVAHVRGGTISILDLSLAIGGRPLENPKESFVIIAEYNRSTQGFLVNGVDRIINMNWEDIQPPPKGTGRDSYLTAVTEVGDDLVEIIDVEKILAEVVPPAGEVSEEFIDREATKKVFSTHVLISDDSAVARKQVKKVVESMGLTVSLCKDGKEALDFLEAMVKEGKNPAEELLAVISDIEMPEMDGYTFTAEVRSNPKMKDLHIVLHTSLSGVFNEAMVEKVGANAFQAKFKPDELAKCLNERIHAISD